LTLGGGIRVLNINGVVIDAVKPGEMKNALED
jgi:hypothetical protein